MKPIHAKMGPIKDRNGRDLKEAEDIKRGGKKDSVLLMQGAWVQSLVRELEPTNHSNTHCSQINKPVNKYF